MLGVWAQLRAPTRKSEDFVDRQNNKNVKAVSPGSEPVWSSGKALGW